MAHENNEASIHDVNADDIERLKLLLKYEFNEEMSLNDMVKTLVSSRHNVGEAYRVLKERNKPSTSSTPENYKRRQEDSSQLYLTPSKRKRDKEECSDSIQQEISFHEESGNNWTNEVEVIVDIEKAREIMDRTVDEMTQNRVLNVPQWISIVWNHLHVTHTLELAKLLDNCCEALAQSLELVDLPIRAANKENDLGVLLDVIKMLPDQKKGDLLCKRPLPTDEELNLQDEEVKKLANAPKELGVSRSISSKNIINCITIACATYLERMAWSAQLVNESKAAHNRVHAELKKLNNRINQMLEKSSSEVESCSGAVEEARKAKEKIAETLRIFVEKRRKDLESAGECEANAEFQAYMDILNSNDDEIVSLRDSRLDCDNRLKMFEKNAMRAKKKLAFYNLALNLMTKVEHHRELSIQNAMKYIVSRREESDRRAIAALISYIPLLCNALLQFNMFHSTQQVKAQEELEEQRHVLETHIELFGDSAPIKKEDIERRIREFVNIINKSTQLSLQLADSQKRTWIERKNVLTPQISQILVEEYRAILEHMRGPMREVLRAFVDELTGKHNQDVIEPIVSLKSEATSASAVTTTSDVMSSPTIHEEITRFVEQRGYFKKSDELPDLSDTNLKEEPQSNNSFSESDLVKSSKHEFPVGSVLYTKFNVGGTRTEFFRGRVEKLLDDGTYSMAYDDGDIFTVSRTFLFTQDQMEEDIKTQQNEVSRESASMEQQSGSTCIVM